MILTKCEHGHFYDASIFERCPHCGGAKVREAEPEYNIPLRFRRLGIITPIARGSTCRVYRVDGERQLALKAISCSPDPTQYRRALYEVRVMERLAGCSHVVELVDRETEEFAPNAVFILEQYCTSLDRRLAGRRVPLREILRILIGLCEAVQQLAERQVLHLDLKPKNIYLDDSGNVRLGDFGSALFFSDLPSNQTTRGTLEYMAPEVYQDHRCSEQSEVYSIGLILYDLLNGRQLPFSRGGGGQELAVYKRLAGTKLPELRFRAEDMSNALNGLLQQACAYRVENRIESVEKLRVQLEQLVQMPGSLEVSVMMPSANALGAAVSTLGDTVRPDVFQDGSGPAPQPQETSWSAVSYPKAAPRGAALPRVDFGAPLHDGATANPWGSSKPHDESAPYQAEYAPGAAAPAERRQAPRPEASMARPSPPRPAYSNPVPVPRAPYAPRAREEAACDSDATCSSAEVRRPSMPPAPMPGHVQGAKMRCSSCGQPLTEGQQFCSFCGSSVRRNPSAATGPAAGSLPRAPQRVAVKKAAPKIAQVEFSALAPKRLNKGEYAIIDFVMYEESYRYVVDEIHRQAEEPLQEKRSGTIGVTAAAKIRVVLSSPDFEIQDGEQEGIWEKSYLEFSFPVMLPEDYAKKQVLFQAKVYVNGIIASRLSFVAKCFSFFEQRLPVERRDISTAFVSYASQDRKRVASIVQGMQMARPDLDVFFDVEGLRGGDDWERVLYREIEKRDVLYLCWSHNAKSSPWVDREWRYALSQKGIAGIEPLPIEPPEACPPPAELNSKYWSDKLLYLIEYTPPRRDGAD